MATATGNIHLTWSPGSATGVEGSAIDLGAITETLAEASPLSLMVGAIPVGAVLSDGSHSFTATAGATSVDIAGWDLSTLTITPVNDTNFALTVTARGLAPGRIVSANAAASVTVDPLAPVVAWSPGSASGAAGSAIKLGALGDTVNSRAGDSNTLQSLVVGAIPVGATLSDGSHSFTATAASSSVNVAGWTLSGLTITTPSAASFTLTATATVEDAGGNTSTAMASEAVTVTGAPASGSLNLAWTPNAESGTEGAAIALGVLSETGTGVTLQSLVIGAIPVGATLSDGSHSFTASASSSSVDAAGWNLSKLTVTPANDADFTLTATATAVDASSHAYSASASAALTVDPLAPTVAWSPGSASGAAGSAIMLGALGDTVNGLAGDGNTLQSLMVGGVPAGATLSDGSHSFTGSASSSAVNVAGWNLAGLTIAMASAASFNLAATATVADAQGATSSALATEAVTVTGANPVSDSSGYVDGATGAPAGAAELPTILGGYAVRPPWQVAGVDYHVGVPNGTVLKDPTIAGALPAGATYNATNHTVTVTGNNVTLDGFDFSLHGGIELIIQSANVTVEDSKFVVGTNPGDNPTHPAFAGTVIWTQPSASNVTFLNNEIDGGNVAVTPQSGATLWINNTGAVTFEYNYFHNSGGDMVDFTSGGGAGPQTDVVEYNLFKDIGVNTAHADTLQWYGSRVAGGTIGFNTVYQNVPQPGAGNGGLTLVSEGTGATMSNVTVNNDTIIETATGTSNWTTGFYADSGGSGNNVVIHDLYIDPTGVYTPDSGGMWLLATGYYHDALADPMAVANVTNMTTGQTYTSLPTRFSFYVAPDVNGYSPSLSDVYSVTASPSSGALGPGNTIIFTVNLDESYAVTGTPAFTLNDGGTATYAGGSGTNALTFSYTVGAADTAVSALAITKVNLPSGATVKDSVGNEANLSGAVASFSGLATDPPPPSAQPSITWAPSSESGTEGSAIALGSIATTVPTGDTLQSLVVSAIPVGAALSDGTHSFSASTTDSAVDLAGWNLSALMVIPPNDANFALSATVTAVDGGGHTATASASEALTVDPLAPTVAWSPGSASGAAGSAIKLGILGDTVNGLAGDGNTLQSLVIGAIPVGATLSDGSHSFTASAANTAINVAGWTLSGLTISLATAASFSLTATATAQDVAGNTSTATASEALTVTGGVSPPPPSGGGSPQLPNLFAGYAVRPPWEVAGVDYAVGVPGGTTLKDPAAAGALPAGASIRGQNIYVNASNVTLSGFDFSLHGSYGIYIEPGVSGTTITNSNFLTSADTIAVNIAAGASNTSITHNTIDGGGASGDASFGELIYNLGAGLTVENNWIKNAPGRFVSDGGGGGLTYDYNLLENGGVASGEHLNYLEFGSGTFTNPQVDYNTMIQGVTASGGEGFQMYLNGSGSISNGDIGYNTLITIPSGSALAESWILHAGSNSQYPAPAVGAVHDNYVDARGAYGPFYGGLSGFTFSNNINLVTGAHF